MRGSYRGEKRVVGILVGGPCDARDGGTRAYMDVLAGVSDKKDPGHVRRDDPGDP